MKSFHRRSSRPAPSAPPPVATPVLRHGLQRVDSLLVEQGLAASRTLAQRLIAAGRVRAEGEVVSKPSLALPATARLSVSADDADRYVSRGGLKLAGALAATGLEIAGRDCLDVGQSTGGFSDCLLQAGARRVVGVDVGHGQLHPQLQADPRVVALEGINCRHLCPADLGAAWPEAGFDLIVGDVSFISLTLILPQLPPLLAATGDLLLLVKPQFELGPQALGKGGVVRDASDYSAVEQRLRQAAADCGLQVRHWFPSPLIGGGVGHIAGNREFFIWLRT